MSASALSRNDLHRIFEKLDRNGDGKVSLEELNWLLERIGVEFESPEELEALVVGKPCLSFDEFLAFHDSIWDVASYGGQGGEGDVNDLVKAFEVFDVNGDGVISSEELQKVLGRLGLWDESCGNDCRSMISVFDANLDGVLDFEEFKNMMLST